MKKTLTANIGGTVFNIEEDAFERLQRYLSSIRAQFAGSPSAPEIMADIEARIAELLQQRLDGRQVVDITDVEHVIGIMGQPEDFADGEGAAEGAGEGTGTATGAGRRRRLYRDAEDRWVGGVLGGVAAYFNIDPLILRLIYLIALFMGWGIVLYIVLWIVVPAAHTAAEKLEMRGEPVNVDNIKRMFEEGADRVKSGAEQVAGEAKDLGRKYGPRVKRNTDGFFAFLGEMIRLCLVFLGKFFGLILLLFGAGLAVMLMVVIFGRYEFFFTGDSLPAGTSLEDWSNLFFATPKQANMAWLAAITLLLVPVIGMLYGGISLLFDVKGPRWLGWILAPVWILSIVVLTVIGIHIGNDFRVTEELRDEVTIAQPAGKVILLRAVDDPHLGHMRGGDHRHDWHGPAVEGDRMLLAWSDVDIERSTDSLFHLVVQRSASGINYEQAAERARDIHAEHQQTDSVLSLPPLYSISRNGRWREQEIRYVLMVPVGGAVRLDESTLRMLDDIENVSSTWDDDMVGRTWTMTAKGLQDLSAPAEDEKEEKSVVEQIERSAHTLAATVWHGLPKTKRADKAEEEEDGSTAVLSATVFDLIGRVVKL